MVLDLELQRAKKLLKKHNHPHADRLIRVGVVKEEGGKLWCKDCTFDMKGMPLDLDGIIRSHEILSNGGEDG